MVSCCFPGDVEGLTQIDFSQYFYPNPNSLFMSKPNQPNQQTEASSISKSEPE